MKQFMECYPSIEIRQAMELALEIGYFNTFFSVNSKRKPKGAKFCEIYYTSHEKDRRNPKKMILLKRLSRSPERIFFSPEYGGEQVFMTARWADDKGNAGPWSPVINFTVPHTKY